MSESRTFYHISSAIIVLRSFDTQKILYKVEVALTSSYLAVDDFQNIETYVV